MSTPSLPQAALDELFERMKVRWGAQKFGAMVAGLNRQAVEADWRQQLGEFSANTLNRAFQEVTDSGREWPPSLAEFRARCLACRMPGPPPTTLHLPSKGRGTTDRETARRNLASIKAMLGPVVKPMHRAHEFVRDRVPGEDDE